MLNATGSEDAAVCWTMPDLRRAVERKLGWRENTLDSFYSCFNEVTAPTLKARLRKQAQEAASPGASAELEEAEEAEDEEDAKDRAIFFLEDLSGQNLAWRLDSMAVRNFRGVPWTWKPQESEPV